MTDFFKLIGSTPVQPLGAICVLSLLLVHLTPRVCLGYPVFLPPEKPTCFLFQFDGAGAVIYQKTGDGWRGSLSKYCIFKMLFTRLKC